MRAPKGDRRGPQDKRDKGKGAPNKVVLQQATVKAGAEEAADAGLQYCFRVVSQRRSYVLQAEDDLAASEWIETIQVPLRRPPRSPRPLLCLRQQWQRGELF